MVDGINNPKPKTFMRNVNGQKQEVIKTNGKFFTKNSNGEMVELEKTRKGSIFWQAQFSIKQQDILPTEQKAKEPKFDEKGETIKWSTDENANAMANYGMQQVKEQLFISKEYDSNGNITKEVEYTNFNKNQIVITEFNSNNKVIKQTYSDVAGAVSSSLNFEYDENGNLLSEIRLNSDGKIESTAFYSNGKPIKTETYNSEGKIEQAETIDYDESGNIATKITYHMGVPTYKRTFEYDENNKCIKCSEYCQQSDSDGKIIENTELIKIKEFELLQNGNTRKATWMPDGTPISVRELSGNRIP